MAAPDPGLPEIKLDASALYREDVYTDRRAGTIRVMTPVTADGGVDHGRPMLYAGQTQLMTPGGVLPLMFEIEASSLAQAIERFPEAVKQALEEAIEEAREMRREAASRIVVPEAGAGAPLGAPPGGGRIKFP
jgi:hypothetical protein